MIRYFFVPILIISVAKHCSSLPSSKTGMTSRIVNGAEVESDGYVVGLKIYKDENAPTFYSRCGGTLIDNSRVLTAAHCFFKKGATTYDPTIVSRTQLLINSIYYDDMRKDPSDRAPGAIVTKPVGLLIHPEYNHQHNDNDVAILFLDNPVPDDVKIAELPKDGQTFDSDEAVTMGWGASKTDGVASNTLLKADMVTMTNEKCIEKVPEAEKTSVMPFHICSYGRDDPHPETNLEDDSCQGDSGGPLLVGDVVAGIVSFNFDNTVCGQPGTPAVYARVTYYLDWIKNNVNAPESPKPEEETIENEVKRSFTEQNPLSWRGHYQNYHVGLPISYYGFNAVPTLSSPLWHSYQIFNPAYGQNGWSIRG